MVPTDSAVDLLRSPGNWRFRPIPTSWMTDMPHPWPRITWAHGAPRLLAPIPRRGAMAPAGAPCHWKKGMIQQISPWLHHNLRLVLSRLWPIHMCYMVLNGFNILPHSSTMISHDFSQLSHKFPIFFLAHWRWWFWSTTWSPYLP